MIVRMAGCYTDCIRHNLLLAALFAFAALPLHAIESGRAEGTIVIGGAATNLGYAYAIGGQKDEASGRTDDIKIILTDKALPDGFDLRNIETSFPDNITGIVFAIDHDRQPSHVYIGYASGMYDAGYFTKSEIYRFRGKMADGVLEGRASARKVTTSTTTMSFDVQFAAGVQ
jgi:hypothetical protein